MKTEKRAEYISRDAILNLLSDDEVASVSTAETAVRLAEGDEYVDLEKLDLGVQSAPGTNQPAGRLVPRKAVHENTWTKILKQLTEATA